MLEQMTARHLEEWRAYFAQEHLGENEWTNFHWGVGIIASTIANANRGQGQAARKPDDFLPKYVAEDAGPMGVYNSMHRLARKPRKLKLDKKGKPQQEQENQPEVD